MVKHMKHKFGIFGLTWLLGPEGSPDEETRTNSCSIIFFFEEVEGFVRTASGAATSVAFSCESAVSSRASSWGLDSILVLVSRTRRCPLGRRSEENIGVKTKQRIRSKFTGCMSSVRKTYDASIPNFGMIFFSVRGGGWQLKGEAGIALLPSSPEVKRVSSKSSESSTTSVIRCLFGALDGDGAAEVDPSGTSVKLRPGYSPISGWGG
jgi:hypothetical protein